MNACDRASQSLGSAPDDDSMTESALSVGIAAFADSAVKATIRILDERRVMWLEIAGGKHHGAITLQGGEVGHRAIRLAISQGIPIVVVIDSGGADVNEGVSALHGWGMMARALVAASGVVPSIFVVTGACVSGPALLLGLADVVLMTSDAFSYVSGPRDVAKITGMSVTRMELGGSGVHASMSGVASIVVGDDDSIEAVVATALSYLPSNALDDPPSLEYLDDASRCCELAAAAVPHSMSSGYDVRLVLEDVFDSASFFELRSHYAPNMVTGFARLGGRSVGVVANQPSWRAGTLDIEASQKGARFVAWCDAFNIPLVTFVDTPGFEPGRDLEWRGMIRHGAQLVHAYCEATVPRICVVLRKAYGGAYIVMDSRGIGNDVCVAWPEAEIAVMGTDAALQILGSKGLTAGEYEARVLNPWEAAAHGLIDDVIAPEHTRGVLCNALETLIMKRIKPVARRHSNSPL